MGSLSWYDHQISESKTPTTYADVLPFPSLRGNTFPILQKYISKDWETASLQFITSRHLEIIRLWENWENVKIFTNSKH